MKFLKNVAFITVPAILLSLIFLELVARFLLPTSDFPDVLFHPVFGNQFAPNQTGTYVYGPNEEIQGRYRINAQGWNSPYDYEEKKSKGVYRIAVIGDSYVEALQVDVDQAFPILLEQKLARRVPGKKIQSYAFGHSGANLIQNLVVFEEVAKKYQPDLMVLLIIHNDFMESFEGHGRVDNSTLRYENGSYSIVSPRPANTMEMKRFFRNSALVRYLMINQNLLQKIRFVRDWYNGDTRKVDANVSLDKAGSFPLDEMERMLTFAFDRFKKTAMQFNIRLLFAMNTARFPEDAATHGKESTMNRYNELSEETAGKLGIPFLDLTPAFQRSWEQKGRWHKWLSDSHYNLLGHEVVAGALAEKILALDFSGEETENNKS